MRATDAQRLKQACQKHKQPIGLMCRAEVQKKQLSMSSELPMPPTASKPVSQAEEGCVNASAYRLLSSTLSLNLLAAWHMFRRSEL